jgi:FimV-like protein
MVVIAPVSPLHTPPSDHLPANTDLQRPSTGDYTDSAADMFAAYAPERIQPDAGVVEGTSITVGPDDTIWSIAGSRLWTGATAHQIVAALVMRNPEAFVPDHTFAQNNKRLAPDVSRLFLPPVAEILSIDDVEASKICSTIRPGEQNLRRLAPDDSDLIFGDDTLELIAKRLDVDGATLNQKMVAIFNANTEVFNGRNMYHPKPGELITMPTAEAVLAVDNKSAARIVSDHLKRSSSDPV